MFKNLKSLFIVDENEKSTGTSNTLSKKVVSKVTPLAGEKVEPIKVSVKQTIVSDITGNVDAAIVEKLLLALDKNNLEGFDYLEYKKSLKALEKLPMDEATKYRSAFATSATMGVTLNKLLDTTAFYLEILEKENTQFLNVFKNQFDDKVSNRQREIDQVKSKISEKSEHIKKLTEEIANHQNQIKSLTSQIEESNSKINKTQNDFKKSYAYLKEQIENDVTNMNQYLK